MSGSTRKLNALEQKIHQAALAAEDQTLSMSSLASLEEDMTMRTAALNFLLSAGLLKPMKSTSGKLQFRGVGKKEADVKKDLSVEENLVLNYIQASSNEGIWTKHIKVKTELHQTILDRCLKSLVQKKLVKAVSGSVQHPTRKMYMLFHLEPSVEVTGGPWYTDKELDTEFIKLLSKACLKFIRDRSFPRQSASNGSRSIPSERLLYPISNPPAYPSATQVQAFLNKSRITETQLTVEHVEMLLKVLCIDGDIEKVPAMGAALWDSGMMNGESDDDDDDSWRQQKKKSSRKRKRKTSPNSHDESTGSDADTRKRRKRSAKKRREEESDEESESDKGQEREKERSNVKNKKRRHDEGNVSEEESEDANRKKRKRSKSRSKKRHKDSSDDDSPSSSSSDSDAPSSRKRSRSSSRQAPSKFNLDIDFGSTHVYRAVHPERLAFSFGWSQAPCLRCPTFEFCAPKGPVNPRECVYYGDWLTRKEVEEDTG